jgi:hypothetical protein
MPIAECVITMQTTGGQYPISNPPAAGYFVLGLLGVVLGLMVLIFIRTSGRRSSKR